MAWKRKQQKEVKEQKQAGAALTEGTLMIIFHVIQNQHGFGQQNRSETFWKAITLRKVFSIPFPNYEKKR